MKHQQSAFLHTLRVPLKYSKSLFCLVLAYHLLAIVVLYTVDLTVPVWPFGLLVVLSLCCTGFRYQQQMYPMNAREIILKADDSWSLISADNVCFPAKLLPGSFVHPLLILLALRCNGKTVFVPLLADNCQADLLRRLRVRLRFPRSAQSLPQR